MTMTTMPKKLILKSQGTKSERSKNNIFFKNLKVSCRDVSELLIDEYKGLAQWIGMGSG
jgi:hypothetical protein